MWTCKYFIHKAEILRLGFEEIWLSAINILYFQETDWEWEEKKITHSSINHKKSVVYLHKSK